jgi:hypothetical protein
MYDVMLFVVSLNNAYAYHDLFVNVHWVKPLSLCILWRFIEYWKVNVSEREGLVVKLTPLLNKSLKLLHHKFLFRDMSVCLDSQSPELCVLSRACRLQVYFPQSSITLAVVFGIWEKLQSNPLISAFFVLLISGTPVWLTVIHSNFDKRSHVCAGGFLNQCFWFQFLILCQF